MVGVPGFPSNVLGVSRPILNVAIVANHEEFTAKALGVME
jgi:hypothetical protein